MLHRFDGLSTEGPGGETFSRLMDSRLDYYLGTEAGRRVIAEQYVGLPYETPMG
ncbi:MAG: hypothetical protein OXQ29_27535 [Rhodospirillaceae bacterium]|nr:hypothetical protein [Rhodospirillaceae bacterium]